MILNFNQINHEEFMKEALIEADLAGKRGDRPIGCVIVHNGEIVAKGANSIETSNNNVAHAEINAIHSNPGYIREHARESILYTTVEPCVMCLPTIVMANIRNIVFAIEDKYMAMDHFIQSNPYLKKRVHNYLGNVLKDESIEILQKYSKETASLILHGKI
ncbi:nucleoside deaminase [Ornithinibacillus halophilus]|uniref:tRNA(Adenine34) deaminase/tRNA-specific adenosine deaminase 2 n=1 Tax=Ornithinibacillus halophilus TaxID=930117 RepID=A0A1M5H1Q0_9BACI|nr:nucleoside deaminase [Ornithinibacillus halophilus]SHG09845.1 tRNA(adenine34) deaminase/tRNA-specific adenosine deaminase 2 [Ornithinibacillus halophilus]